MHLYYAPDILTSTTLPVEESLHCVKVLRQKVGDLIYIIDGEGTFVEAKIVFPHQKHTEVERLVVHKNWHTRPFSLHIVVAPTKSNDRFEWFLEKATEIGVEEITPIWTRYSERTVIKPERLNKILVAASKQSYKALIPKLNPMIKWADFMKQDHTQQKFLAHCYEDSTKRPLFHEIKPGADVMVLVGPEGDFSEEEVQDARNHGFIMVSLSESRLRTETAGIVATHLVDVANMAHPK